MRPEEEGLLSPKKVSHCTKLLTSAYPTVQLERVKSCYSLLSNFLYHNPRPTHFLQSICQLTFPQLRRFPAPAAWPSGHLYAWI